MVVVGAVNNVLEPASEWRARCLHIRGFVEDEVHNGYVGVSG